MPDKDPRVERVQRFFETLTEQSLAGIDAIYTPDARFKDPFNEVTGSGEVRRILAHMFVQVRSPRFVIRDAVAEGDQAFLTWNFHFLRGGGAELTIRGASHLRFAPDGRVTVHRDYWDAAEELYEKLPLIGALMRWVKRRAAG